MSDVYRSMFGKEFRFNDPVRITCVIMPDSERTGRLVQVRKKCGAYGSDMYFVRRADKSLHCFENAVVEPCDDIVLPDHDIDHVGDEYTLRGEFPETGFLVEEPKQPMSYSPPFSIAIMSGGVTSER